MQVVVLVELLEEGEGGTGKAGSVKQVILETLEGREAYQHNVQKWRNGSWLR